MKILKIEMTFLIAAFLFLTGCNVTNASKADSFPTPQINPSKKSLKAIDLTQIGQIAPKGRVQDKDENQLPVIDDLIANGKDSIPFLIGKLDDETEIKEHVMDYWYKVQVGDVALVILHDFFLNDDTTSTIQGADWDDFLERGNDKSSTAEAILRKYIKKHGRKNIKERWQKMWDENKDKIYWDDTERCFKLKN